jgi:hypothetical protein
MEASPFLSLGKLFLNMSCLALGEISGGYPLVLLPDPLVGCKKEGKRGITSALELFKKHAGFAFLSRLR